MERGRIQGLPIFQVPPIISGTGKATDFKFGSYIHRVHPNKNPLKILAKGSAGVCRDCPIVKSTEVQILYAHSPDLSEQKPIKNFGKSSRGRTQGFSKIFRAPKYRAHRAVIFAVAQLSCFITASAHYLRWQHVRGW